MDAGDLLPPAEAANNAQVLLLWLCGVLLLGVIGLYIDQNRRAMAMAREHREERKCDAKQRGDMWRVIREHFTQTSAHAERMTLLLDQLKGRVS